MARPKIKASDVVNAAEKYIGTPWVDQGRSTTGIDCIGLIIQVYADAGLDLENESKKRYTRNDEYKMLVEELEVYADSYDYPTPLKPGDILIFRSRSEIIFNHVGMYLENNQFIHAYDAVGLNRVVKQPLDGKWKTRISKVFRYKNILVSK